MFFPHQNPVCEISLSDLDALKPALEVIIGADVKPTHRLEIFARLAGYRTYASLKADLPDELDIFGQPTLLQIYNKPRLNDPFLLALSAEVRKRLAQLEKTGILRMVAAALQLKDDPIFGNIHTDPEDIRRVVEAAQAGAKKDLSRDSGGLLPVGPVYLMVSPDNLAELITAAAEAQSRKGTAGSSEGWHMAWIEIDQDTRYFDPPLFHDITSFKVVDNDFIDCFEPDATLVFFDDQDRDAFVSLVREGTGRLVPRSMCITLKAHALEMEDEEEGTFYSIGYHGTARNDLPASLDAISGIFAIMWLCEIANCVHGCEYEFRKLQEADAKQAIGDS